MFLIYGFIFDLIIEAQNKDAINAVNKNPIKIAFSINVLWTSIK